MITRAPVMTNLPFAHCERLQNVDPMCTWFCPRSTSEGHGVESMLPAIR